MYSCEACKGRNLVRKARLPSGGVLFHSGVIAVEFHRAQENPVIVTKDVQYSLYHAEDDEVHGVEYGLLVEARSVAALNQDPVKIFG